MNDKIETSLFKALNSNDEREIKSTFELIYNSYYKLVYFCISKYIDENETIKDLVNDSFVDFFENAHKVKSSIKYYLLTIAKNKAITYLKRYKNIIYLEDTLILNNPSYSLKSNVAYTDLVDDLKAILSEKEVEIIIHHAVEGMTFKELEELYNIKAKTINKIYERAIKKFKNSERSRYHEK